jgi:tetratricopeptide (TPR) repeat protein
MSYGLGDHQAALVASQEAVNLYRQLEDRFNLGFGLGYLGNMAAFQDDVVLAEHALVEAIQIGRELGSSLILCFALGVFSHYVALPRGDIITARTYAEESSRYAREIGMSWAEAQGEVVMARISSILGQWDEARQYAQKAAAIFQNLRDPGTLTIAYNELAGIELHTGNLAEARRYLKECIITGKELNLRTIVAQALESYAYIAQAQNLPIRAVRLLGAAEAVREGLGTSVIAVHRLENDYESTVTWLHAQFDETVYDEYWSEGCGMSMEQAVSYALEE